MATMLDVGGTYNVNPSGVIESQYGYSGPETLSSSDAIGNRHFDILSGRDFYSYHSRRARHTLMRAMNEGTAYMEEAHAWADQLKVSHGMTPNAHPVFNVVPRIVDFWANHTYCGWIDEAAGDGKIVYSSMPFLCKSEASRPLISRILKQSRFGLFVHTLARLGAMCGEVGLMAVNDRVNRRSYLEVIDPESIVECVNDPTGTCLAYRLVEWRYDPRPGHDRREQVAYREDVELMYGRDGKPFGCQFKTFLDDRPFPWPENGPSAVWTERYPFVPFVLIPHIRMSQRFPWGHSEPHNALIKIFKLDDMASRYDNQVGVAVDPIYLFAGVDPPSRGQDPVVMTTAGLDEQGNEIKFPALYGSAEAKAQALLSSLDLSHVDIHMMNRLANLENEYPELRKDIQDATGDASGKALRAAQMKLTTKAVVRRSGYDMAVVECLKMCIRQSAFGKYAGFEETAIPATEENPAVLDFSIDGSRPIFMQAPEDKLDVEKMELANAESADRAGEPLPAYWARTGREGDVPALLKAQKAYQDRGLDVGRSSQAKPVNDVQAKAVQSKGGAKGLAPGR